MISFPEPKSGTGWVGIVWWGWNYVTAEGHTKEPWLWYVPTHYHPIRSTLFLIGMGLGSPIGTHTNQSVILRHTFGYFCNISESVDEFDLRSWDGILEAQHLRSDRRRNSNAVVRSKCV